MVYFNRKAGDYMSEYIKYKGAGIYCLTNERSGKKYIGSSKNVAMRVYQHQAALKAGRHENKAMQADYDSGDRFMASVVIKVVCGHKAELFTKEAETINCMKAEGNELYNIQPMKGEYYETREQIIQYFADQFCREHFGMPMERFFFRSPAAYNMMYKILREPEREKEIRAEYSPLIKYQNRDSFYRSRAGVSYDEYLNMSAEEQAEVNKRAHKRRVM